MDNTIKEKILFKVTGENGMEFVVYDLQEKDGEIILPVLFLGRLMELAPDKKLLKQAEKV